MNDDDALPFEMRRLPGSPGSSPPTLDHDTADRLLVGRLDPADAPPELAALAMVVTAATAPATPEELAGEPAAVARFAAMTRSGSRSRAATRRASAPRRILTIRLAMAVLAAVLTIGGVAAATGVIPGPAKPPAGHRPGSTGGGGGTPTTAAAGRTGTATTQVDRSRGGTATGPDASGPAMEGLCRAWQAGQGERNGRREDSTAFQALAAAAGGVDRIDAYCQATTPEHPKDTEKDKEKGSGGSPGNGGSPGHGSGNGHGGPPPTTD
jgi:hypothetical protein